MSQAKTLFIEKKRSTDLLSNLQDDLRLRILECLPLQDAVRTSILSTRWKYKWTTRSQIILDQQFFSTVLNESGEESEAAVTYSIIVNHVLLCHVGPLCKFELYIPGWFSINDSIISHWLRFVTRKNVSELTLHDSRARRVKLPSTVFIYSGLTCLKLVYCNIATLPPSFTGFPSLVSLTFISYCFDLPALVERLISSCPQLRHLDLDISEVRYLIIHAPKLEYLNVGGHGGLGSLDELCLGKETTQVRSLNLNFRSSPRLILVFSSPAVLQRLSLGPYFFTNSYGHGRFSEQGFVNDLEWLKNRYLELIDVPLQCPSINCFALKLLSSSQSLQRLYIKVSEYKWRRWKIPTHLSNCNLSNIKIGNLPNLKYVELVGISGLRDELQFIKVILECAQVLEVMTIKLSDKVKEDKDKLKISMELMQYYRVSRNLQIIFKT